MAPSGQDEIDPDFEANTSTSEDEDETMNDVSGVGVLTTETDTVVTLYCTSLL